MSTFRHLRFGTVMAVVALLAAGTVFAQGQGNGRAISSVTTGADNNSTANIFLQPVDPALDTVLTRGEQEGWTSDKTTRREAIAERYRLILLVGDDFNDFISARLPRAERDRLVERYQDRWGERWIVLPNPTYGSWESALYGEGELTAEDRARLRLEALEDLRP